MASFHSYSLQGLVFILFGIYQTIQIFRRFYICKRNNTCFTSTLMWPCDCLCGRRKNWPIEAILLIILTSVGVACESLNGSLDTENGQQATVFFFFGMVGIINVLMYFRVPLPANLDYFNFAIALGIEGLVLHFNLHGQTDLKIRVHTLLVYIIYANVLTVLAEMRYTNNVLSPLSRNYLILLQGTWLWQIGFILFNPIAGAAEWQSENHDHLMIATMCFVWHCGGLFIFMLLIGAVVAWFHRWKYGLSGESGIEFNRLGSTDTNSKPILSLNDYSDNDLEFEKPVSK